MISRIHSSEVWCWMMNSSSSWCSGSLSGCWADEQPVELEVAGVGPAAAQVAGDALLDAARRFSSASLSSASSSSRR